MQVIVYMESEGAAIVVPTDEALQLLSVQEIAVRVVPAGKKFKIMSAESLPADQAGLMLSDDELMDGVGGFKNE